MAAALGLGVAVAGPALAAAPAGLHRGSAYGTAGNVTVGPLAVGLGTTAFLPCPCRGTNGAVVSANVAGVAAGVNGNVLRTGAVLSTIQTTTTSSTTTDEVVSKLSNIDLFNGLVKADAIVAVSRTVANATSVRSDDLGSTLVNLTIAGRAIAPTIAPNTVVSLPGIGTATLKQRIGVVAGAQSSYLDVNMIAITVLEANTYGVPIGTRITIAHAGSGFRKIVPEVVYSGIALGTFASANVGSLISNLSSMTALQAVGCLGTDGKTLSSSISAVSLGSLVSVGGAVTTSFAGSGKSKTTSTVTNVSLLNGLVRAASLTAVADTTVVGGRRVRSTTGSGFTGLRVLGIPVPISVAPNTRITLPGIGFVVINAQTLPAATSNSPTVVSALQIYITQANILNLPVGASILLGRASAGVDVAAGV